MKHHRSRADIERLYVEQGLVLNDVAAKLGVSRASLTRIMREYGIPIRAKGIRFADMHKRIAIAPDGCWLWMGHRNRTNYGRITRGRKQFLVHRVMYEERVGPIPTGLELDHLCHNPPCCNPDHLEIVTRQENARRAAEHRWRRAA